MNTTCCFSKIPEELKKQIGELISQSGIPEKDFVKELADYYNIKDTTTEISPVALDYTNYWNSFVD